MFAASDDQIPSLPIMDTDGRWRGPHIHQAPNCPRCASPNTKFCYYNNYSLAQPRYLCKACRRYWTKGGSLRNVAVGGGCRKTRRSRSKATTTDTHQADDSTSSLFGAAAEINRAAVFASYLNKDSVSAIDPDHQVSAPGDCQDQGNSTMGDLESLDHGLLQTDQDVLWSTSEDGSSLSSGFGAWDTMDSSPLGLYDSNLVDQFSSPSTNSFLSDINWSCFDMGGYGDFCGN